MESEINKNHFTHNPGGVGADVMAARLMNMPSITEQRTDRKLESSHG